jgi:putative transposase
MYFVTVCAAGHKCWFGHITGETMQMNNIGRMVERCWREIPAHFPSVALDEFIVMPNHLHGVLVIVGANDYSPLPPNDVGTRPRGTTRTIGSIIRGFKIGVTKWMRENAGPRDVWQRNYFEHVIRNETSLNRIRRYIVENPMRWAFDRENPEAVKPDTGDPW